MSAPAPITLTSADTDWPASLAERMGTSAPPALQVIGPVALLVGRKTALFCSARTPGDAILRAHDTARRLRDQGHDGHQRLSLAHREGVPAHPPARQAAHHTLPGPSDRGNAHPGGVPRCLRCRPPAFSLALHRIAQARHQRLGTPPQRGGRRPR